MEKEIFERRVPVRLSSPWLWLAAPPPTQVGLSSTPGFQIKPHLRRGCTQLLPLPHSVALTACPILIEHYQKTVGFLIKKERRRGREEERKASRSAWMGWWQRFSHLEAQSVALCERSLLISHTTPELALLGARWGQRAAPTLQNPGVTTSNFLFMPVLPLR